MNPNNIDKLININQDGKDNTQNNIFSFQPPQIEGNPFAPPQPREGGLFGRDDELAELHQLLQSGKNVCVVSGMGGVGKTRLVREYAHSPECKTHFSGGVYYIDVRDRQNLAAEIVTLTRWKFNRDLQDDLSPKQKVTQCWQAWKMQTEKVLLILDDVADLAENLKPYLPPSDLVTVRLLMTSREIPDKQIAETLSLEILSLSAAVDLLASIIGANRVAAELEQAEKLCEDLGRLPLALELVGYYLKDEDYQQLSLLAMRQKLEYKVKHPALSPEEVPMGMQAQRGLQAAFDLSWEKLKPEAKYLACVLGAFASSPIHWDFVTAIYNILQEESFSPDDLKDRWLKSLRKLHFVILVEEDIYNLHLLVSDYFSEQLKKHSDYSKIKQAFCDVFADVAGNVNQSRTLATFNLIEPHLKKMIAWCKSNENTQLATSLNGLATLYYTQGRYSKAEPLYQQSLEIRKRLLGLNHPAVASSLNNLAALYKSQGHYSNAELLYQQSLEIKKFQLGLDHPDVATSLNNLATLYYSQGRYSEAEALIQQSLEIRKSQLGLDHLDVASTLNNLASLYNSQGRYSEAEPLIQQSLEIRKSQLGLEHPDVASTLNNLATLYCFQGRYSEAEPLIQQSLEIRKSQLGLDHLSVATSLNNLAALYKSQRRYSKAEPLLQQSLKISQRQLGLDHSDVAFTLNHLAGLYCFQGRYSEAEPLFQQSLEIRKRQLGLDHPDVAASLNDLALLYHFQGRYSDAEFLYQQSLEIRKRLLGQDHPDVATSFNNLALLYEAQNKYAKAESLSKQALAIYQKKLGNKHPNTQKVAFIVKALHIMSFLHCNKETLFDILQALAQQAEIPAFNPEVALAMLEKLESNPELLSYIREALQQQTEASDGNT
ncbi:Tfp pilus assembly protein PilF [Cylindrospermum stagnale PCC 7417]|uniref:Tfp pilus assembly protein PilF n=1 Tax=Cylindrospermum stagnale PCC 7417 TaxID=56107 RepID=K9X4D0_9NOST|nr:tetratricopeptide repeat protein [Cylindrospermum stagnale]AFZ27510.1 Tfp pilus assembly protein PilF [Cylindrospermum stagnale PCC 7417]